jgi:uncharacterized protein (TIGR03437 family)
MANPVPPHPRILLPILHATDQSAVSPQNPVTMGEYLEVFCDDANADVLYPMDWREEGPEYWPVFPFFGHPVKALFGGVCTWVNWAGPAPGYPNLCQVNIWIPPGRPDSSCPAYLAPGCIAKLYILADWLASEPTLLPVG